MRSNSASNAAAAVDYRLTLSFEDRLETRQKITEAYMKHSSTREELLAICVAMGEEMIFQAAPNRLAYKKHGVLFDRQVGEKMAKIHEQNSPRQHTEFSSSSSSNSREGVAEAASVGEGGEEKDGAGEGKSSSDEGFSNPQFKKPRGNT